MANLFVIVCAIASLICLGHVQAKSEEVMLTLTFERQHQVPALFTPLDDHVMMTVEAWTTTDRIGNGTCIYLQDIPPQYAWKRVSAFAIFVRAPSGKLGWLGLHVNINRISICPHEGYFDRFGKVGFTDLTIVYAIT
jgi:hypothetical protein